MIVFLHSDPVGKEKLRVDDDDLSLVATKPPLHSSNMYRMKLDFS